MHSFSHRDYFRRYKLNVEQYGEILVAEAFHGDKMGDVQPGYDIRVCNAAFEKALRTVGIDPPKTAMDETDGIRIEVKSKLSRTGGGRASVVHCNDCKLDGRLSKKGIQRLGMTHLAIIIVDPGSRADGDPHQNEGRIENAWLLSAKKAREMRRKDCKTQCIYIQQLRNECSSEDFFEITRLLNRAANEQVGDVFPKCSHAISRAALPVEENRP
jgi:hypothetical protein